MQDTAEKKVNTHRCRVIEILPADSSQKHEKTLPEKLEKALLLEAVRLTYYLFMTMQR